MEVRSDDTTAVIDVYDIAGEEKISNERHNTAVRRVNWCARGSAKIDAKMPARKSAVEHPAGSEATRYDCIARPNKRRRPHGRRIMRPPPDLARLSVLSVDSRLRLSIHRLRKAWRDRKCSASRSGRRRLRPGNRYLRNRTIDLAGRALDHNAGNYIASCICWNRPNRAPRCFARLFEVQLLARHFSA